MVMIRFVTDGLRAGLGFEARWHTRTPDDPADAGNSWVVTRRTPGSSTGIPKQHHVLTGNDEWTPMHVWKSAVTTGESGTATEQQQRLLDREHHPAN